MSHKQEKKTRARIRKWMPEVLELPKSILEAKFTGRFHGITKEGMEAFKRRTGYYPLPNLTLTDKCQKYFFKRG